MNQIEAILNHFEEYSRYMGLNYLWDISDTILKREYPDIEIQYDPDTAFFKSLEVMLNSGNQCLFHNLNGEDPSRDGELLTCSPTEQIKLLKKVWIGKEAMDKMDEENGYLGWWFLNYVPYSLAHKVFDESGQFVKWWHSE